MRRREILKILLSVLVAVFIMVSAATLIIAGFSSSEREEQKKQEALSALENVPTVAPTAAAVSVTPSPTPRPTATPTPVPTMVAAFNPDDFWDYWYSTDGTVTVNVYNISLNSVSFTYYQTDRNQTQSVSADITAEVAGNAARFSFYDSAGNTSAGNLIFDNGQLYLRIVTEAPVSSVYPSVDCIMSREQVQLVPDSTATPTPEVTQAEQQSQTDTQTGEYFFPDSNSRYLTDEDLAPYSYDELELAKNEIYARHGRQFVTQRIADYFNSKSWYQGTVDPDTFDAQQSSIFNEYEMANIMKIDERMAQLG